MPGSSGTNPAADLYEYWYRNGFVAGDIYGRMFYRSLYDVPTS